MAQETPQPPRFLPDEAFPSYAYRPGRSPHPVRDLSGHSHGLIVAEPPMPDPERWRDSHAYLRGIDLFNHGYYWEAHEAWEGLWNACGRSGPTALFLQALIALAAAFLKARMGSTPGMTAHARRVFQLLDDAGLADGQPFMGMRPASLTQLADALIRSGTASGDEEPEALLWPEGGA
jgi:hypothetical protein